MSDKKIDRARATEHMTEMLADELFSLTGRELEEAARAWGVDPAKSKDRIDAAFRTAIKRRNKALLEAAKRIRDEEVSKLASVCREESLNRGELIATLTRRLEEFKRYDAGRVTIQHRNLTDLSDADLASLLGQLALLDKKA